MFGLGLPELGLIMLTALIIFGPAKLPEIGKSIGKTIQEFKRSIKSISEDPDAESSSGK